MCCQCAANIDGLFIRTKRGRGIMAAGTQRSMTRRATRTTEILTQHTHFSTSAAAVVYELYCCGVRVLQLWYLNITEI